MENKREKSPLCGFCHHGSDANAVCGPLYTSELCNAHKKCMQYSALLVQYRTKGFGGFKIRKVVDEMKRGKALSCSLCRSNRHTSKSKSKKAPKGATCGCAVSTCRKTYHYYCAHTDNTTLCRRIEVEDKSTGKKSIHYRIFCSEKHQQLFEKDCKKTMNINYGDQSSSSESENEDDDDEEGELDRSAQAKQHQQQSATVANRSDQTDSSGIHGDDEGEEELDEEEEDSHDGSTDGKADGTPNKSANARQKRPPTGATGTFEKRRRRQEEVNNDHNPSIGELRMIDEPKPESASPTASGGDSTEPGPDFILCIVETPDLPESLRNRLRQSIASNFSTTMSAVHCWSNSGPNTVEPKHMLYYMADIAKAVYDNNTDTLTRLVLGPSATDMDRFEYISQFHDNYMDADQRAEMVKGIRDVHIGNLFVNKHKGPKESGGAFILSEHNLLFLAIPLNSVLDPHMAIRCSLFSGQPVYQLSLGRQLKIPTEGKELQPLSNSQVLELEALYGWLRSNSSGNSKVIPLPKEVVLRDRDADTVTSRLCNLFQDRNDQLLNDGFFSAVVFIMPLNTEVLSIITYCQAVITKFVQEVLSEMDAVYIVLDVAFSSVKQILPSIPSNVKVEAVTGLKVTQHTISSIILKFTIEDDLMER